MGKMPSQEKKQEWQEKIRKQQESGLSIQKWCEENQISLCVFHYWKKKLIPVSFLELKDQKKCLIDIEYEGVHIRLTSATIQQCLVVLSEMQC